MAIQQQHSPRVHQRVDGVPLPARATQPLLNYLKSAACAALWPAPAAQRKGVQSGHYLTLRQSACQAAGTAQATLWNLCRTLLYSVVTEQQPPHAVAGVNYTALAITANFRGSPHMDAHDTTVQYVVAVGDFTGGELCVDDDDDDNDNTTTVTQINVHNRLGRLEGRRVHWVTGWQGLCRYSVVYYSTSAAHHTPVQPQAVHNAWMKEGTAER